MGAGLIWRLCFFAKTFCVSFSLIGRVIDILADLGNVLICVSWLSRHFPSEDRTSHQFARAELEAQITRMTATLVKMRRMTHLPR